MDDREARLEAAKLVVAAILLTVSALELYIAIEKYRLYKEEL